MVGKVRQTGLRAARKGRFHTAAVAVAAACCRMYGCIIYRKCKQHSSPRHWWPAHEANVASIIKQLKIVLTGTALR